MSADQRIQDFLELRADLNALHEGRTPSACVSKFLGNADDLDFAEDARAPARSGSSLEEYVRCTRRAQRKIDLDQERNRASSSDSD